MFTLNLIISNIVAIYRNFSIISDDSLASYVFVICIYVQLYICLVVVKQNRKTQTVAWNLIIWGTYRVFVVNSFAARGDYSPHRSSAVGD